MQLVRAVVPPAPGAPKMQPVNRPAAHFDNAISWPAATNQAWPIAVAVVVAAIVLVSLQMAKAWERAVVLRAGHFSRLAGSQLQQQLPEGSAQ